ncbi:DUF2145 domain-containing protein [Vogesella sp. LIG4]|uniref:DUF2145 domain-containing protein n=1 Tax=Vogesella sp. LIG4 TaxID=1192162 RepID=UPI00081FFAB6|nr:DUF2145 domain-containing protein [Vogesella sp. LIG4]SCK04956.1 hypothetical protein PSELUDRAFT_0040 [Vogesella sp. LIG4]
MTPQLLRRLLLLAAWLLLAAGPAHAGSLLFCDRPASQSTQDKGRLLLFGDAVRQLLAQSGHEAAIVARAGLDLGRFGIRYSHAGISLKQSPNTPWSVRQLYYACDDEQPHLYDQGLSGFLLDSHQQAHAYVSLLLLPPPAEQALTAAALDRQQALAVLSPDYSANAYAFSTRYQNCNQWLAELLASAWGRLPADMPPRAAAQQWLQAQHYQPSNVEVKYGFMTWAASLLPLLHNRDHPAANLAARQYQVSLPGAIDNFVRQQWPGSQRLELCTRGEQLVIHRGWDNIADGCVPGAQDEVRQLG